VEPQVDALKRKIQANSILKKKFLNKFKFNIATYVNMQQTPNPKMRN